jgi:hypothetical protein
VTTGRPVRDEDGTHYLLLKKSDESSLVRDPETGERRHVPNDRLSTVEDRGPLSIYAGAVPDEVLDVLTAVRDEQAVGLLLAIDSEGPVGVRTLLSATTLCESDLHGMLAEFRAAGLIEELSVGGGRGYATTDTAKRGLESLRGTHPE